MSSSQPTISRDIQHLKQLARSNITKYIDCELPFEYDKCLVALNSLQRKAWEISENPEAEHRTKVQALSLAKQCVINKLDLLTNATVVIDAIRFVADKKQIKDKLKSSQKEQDDKESNEPDYNDDEIEEKKEKESDELSREEAAAATVNQIF